MTSLYGPCRNCLHSHGGMRPMDECPELCGCTTYCETTAPELAEELILLRERVTAPDPRDAELVALRRQVTRLEARVSILRTVVRDLMTTGGEAVRWMVHVSESGGSYIDHAPDGDVHECTSVEHGPDTCDCGSGACREAFEGVCRTARAALAETGVAEDVRSVDQRAIDARDDVQMHAGEVQRLSAECERLRAIEKAARASLMARVERERMHDAWVMRHENPPPGHLSDFARKVTESMVADEDAAVALESALDAQP